MISLVINILINLSMSIKKLKLKIEEYLSENPVIPWIATDFGGSSFISLDNDDYWNDDIGDHDQKKMFKEIEKEFEDFLIIDSYDHKDYFNYDVDKEIACKRIRETYYKLLKLQQTSDLKFNIFLAQTNYWRVGLDGGIDCVHNEIVQYLKEDYDEMVTFYLLVSKQHE